MVKVVVLMSTYNGEKYLMTQLDSILNQKGVDVELLVRDDGSTDRTQEILNRYQNEGKLNAYGGANLKPAKSFMNLVDNAPEADYYAFSDQDDYWLPDKLLSAVKKYSYNKEKKPYLYCSAYTMVDENLRILLNNTSKRIVPSTFKQAIASSFAAGCTMVFDHKLFELLKQPHPDFEIMHDNWTYKVCMAVGGHLEFDKNSHIYYRQHDNNVIGGNQSIGKKIKKHLLNGISHPCYRSKSLAILYQTYKEYMPDYNRQIAKLVCDYHKGINRWKIIMDSGFVTGVSNVDAMFKFDVLSGLF